MMRGTIAAVRIAEDMGWIPATVAPIHRRLAKSGGGPGLQFYLFPKVLREAATKGWGELGGRHLVALVFLSWFAFLRVGETASIRLADIRGEKALGQRREGDAVRIFSYFPHFFRLFRAGPLA